VKVRFSVDFDDMHLRAINWTSNRKWSPATRAEVLKYIERFIERDKADAIAYMPVHAKRRLAKKNEKLADDFGMHSITNELTRGNK
jgi:hypothetical protein